MSTVLRIAAASVLLAACACAPKTPRVRPPDSRWRAPRAEPVAPRPYPTPVETAPQPDATARAVREDAPSRADRNAVASGSPVADLAVSFLGTPYRSGGVGPDGFDCSGFVQYVFARFGLSLPRDVMGQYRAASEVDLEDSRPGDLVFFAINFRDISHIGIAIGDDQFVHAPSSGGRVRVERLSLPYWKSRYAARRRVLAPPAPGQTR